MWSLGVYFYLDWIFLAFYSTADNGLDILIKCWKVKHSDLCERNNIFYVPHNLAVVMLNTNEKQQLKVSLSGTLMDSEVDNICLLPWFLMLVTFGAAASVSFLNWPCHQNEHLKICSKKIYTNAKKITNTRSSFRCPGNINWTCTFSPSAIKIAF